MQAKQAGLVVFSMIAVAAEAPLFAADVAQTTGNGSWCSPAQSGNGNTVICTGVDPRAMDRLNELLDRKDLDLKQKTTEADNWAQRYSELNAQLDETKKQLGASGQDVTLVQTAQDLLHDGKLDEARAIFDGLIQSDDANVDRAARDYFGRASVFALQLSFDKALLDYAKAYQYRPNDQRFAESYSYALQAQRDYTKAEAVLQELLRQRREQVARNSTTYSPDLAHTLNNLGILYRDTNRSVDAEVAFKEAAIIERALAAQEPATYRPDLARTLNNLAAIYDETNRSAEAEAAFKEAVEIRRGLAAQNPAYKRDLAHTLNNLGALYDETHRAAEAEAAFKEAVAIKRPLASQNPAAYGPDLAHTLNNLGILYRDTNRSADAEVAFMEAAVIWRERASQNPAAYRPDLAQTLSNLGILYDVTRNFADAKTAFKEAVDIRRELAAQNPAVYGPDLRATLNNLGVLYRDMNRFADAEAAFKEAADIGHARGAEPDCAPARFGAGAHQFCLAVPGYAP
jgi:tetratricopeptide (TPR) repeat protein